MVNISNTLGKRPITFFIIFSYIISWSFSIPAAILHLLFQLTTSDLLILIIIGSFGPSISAILITGVLQGKSGITKLAKRYTNKFSLIWLPIVLYQFFVITTILFCIFEIITWTYVFNNFLLIFINFHLFFLMFSIAGPIGEELGWRGFLLPHIIKKYGEIPSGIIVGLIWTFWHLPLFLITDWRAQGAFSILQYLVIYPITVVLLSILMTYVYKHTNGNVIVAIIVHGTWNIASFLLLMVEVEARLYFSSTIMLLLVSMLLFFIIIFSMYEKLASI